MTDPAELATKRNRVADFLDRHGLDALHVSLAGNLAWASCGGDLQVSGETEAGIASFLLTRDRWYCLTDDIEAARLQDEVLPPGAFELVVHPWHDARAKSRRLRDLTGGLTVGSDTEHTDFLSFGRLLELRSPLTPAEADRYRSLGVDLAGVLSEAARGVRKGMTESKLAASFVEPLVRLGCRVPVALAAADQRVAAYRHPLPTDRAVEGYAMLVVCARRHGLVASCTRLVSLVELDPHLAARHLAVQSVDAAFLCASTPGATLGAALDAGIAAYARAGYADEWRRHHQGGLTGYFTRDARAVPGDHTLIPTGAAVAWNPSIAGTKSEDTCLITSSGLEVLTFDAWWPVNSGHHPPRPEILRI